jgi:hypothetical protein
MRTYANFLLFEDFLEYLPEDSNLLNFANNNLLSPRVKITSEDCGTILGKSVQLNFEAEGLIELANNLPLNQSRINYLLSNSNYSVNIRSSSHCGETSGVCKKCYLGTYPTYTSTDVSVGDSVKLNPLYNLHTDIIVGDGFETKFDLEHDPTDEGYDQVVVYSSGLPMSTGFMMGSYFVTFSTPPAYGEYRAVKFYRTTSSPFLGYFSKTYSGGLFGIHELPTERTLLKPSIYESMLTDNYLATLFNEVSKYKVIPSTVIEYYDKINSKFEKILFILYLYSVYGSLNE